MESQLFDFTGATGKHLSGRIELPQAATRGWAIFAHCFSCGKDSLAAARVSQALARGGIGVLRFDFAGLGGSDGEFGNGTFATDVNDLVAAAEAMIEVDMVPSLLVGHSLGGAVVLHAAGTLDSVKAVVTISAPDNVAHILRLFDPQIIERIEMEGKAEVSLAGRDYIFNRGFVDNVREHDLVARAKDLKRPLLVLHAPGDTTVGIDNASRIFQAAMHPKSFVSLDSADHLLTRRSDADYVSAVIAAWVSRYLPMPEGDSPPTPNNEGVSVVETGRGNW